MIRNRSFRRLVIAATLFMGLFTQFQAVFACGFKNGQIQFFSNCDNSGDKTGDHTIDISNDCAENNQCAEQQAVPKSDNAICCDVSYQQLPSTTAISSAQHNQQVMVLDAPQPPPILASFSIKIIPAVNRTTQFFTNVSLLGASTQTYLLTQRFRI
jgi:hypothetical protein